MDYTLCEQAVFERPKMNQETIPEKMIITQIEEALEERQTPDRRKREQGLPPEVNKDRREGDRRSNR